MGGVARGGRGAKTFVWRHRPPRRPVPALPCPPCLTCRKRGRDGTTYSHFHPSNHLSHHLAGIVTAAVFSDAAHIVEEIALLNQDSHQRRDEDRGGG